MKTLLLLGALGALATFPLTAQAARPIPRSPPADTNGDHKVDLQEYQTSRRDYLMAADYNKDGKVTRAEWDRKAKSIRHQLTLDGVPNADVIGHGEGWFEAVDANKDGVITPAEIDAFTGPRFATLDLNHDGYIDRKEAERLTRQAMSRR